MPGLTLYQSALASAVSGAGVEGATSLLGGMSVVGIAMTARVRRSWCMGRARRAAPLTLSALSANRRSELLSAWVEAGGGTRSFFEQEAEAFLAFIAERLDDPSHALGLCRFERAVVRARTGTAGDGLTAPSNAAVLERSPDADLVVLRASLEALLGALDGSRPWPDLEGEARSLLIAPGIEGLAREADGREIALWNAAASGVRMSEDPSTARELVRCGALRIRLQD